MGYHVEVNWVLKVDETGDLRDPAVQARYRHGFCLTFEKRGARTYPVGVPVLWADGNGNVIGWVSLAEVAVVATNPPVTKVQVGIWHFFDEADRQSHTRIAKEMYHW